jgi:hypothetical protein
LEGPTPICIKKNKWLPSNRKPQTKMTVLHNPCGCHGDGTSSVVCFLIPIHLAVIKVFVHRITKELTQTVQNSLLPLRCL